VSQQRRQREQQHSGYGAGCGLRRDRGENNLAQALGTAGGGIGDEANSRATETKVEHARAFCHSPGKGQKAKSRGSERVDGDWNEEYSRDRRNSEG
jgi:hypothetical protein